jgi:hypothetical protein
MSSRSRTREEQQIPELPTPIARRFVRYLVGFGVGVAIGLAPYLGKLRLPLFAPLLDLIPQSLQDTVLPLSAALMGMLAVFVQWTAAERPSQKWLRTMFRRTLVLALVGFVLLVVAHTYMVETIPVTSGESTGAVSLVIGLKRPADEGDCRGLSNAACIKSVLTMDQAAVTDFWGDHPVRLSRLALIATYLLFTSSFGLLVGLLVLRREGEPRGR